MPSLSEDAIRAIVSTLEMLVTRVSILETDNSKLHIEVENLRDEVRMRGDAGQPASNQGAGNFVASHLQPRSSSLQQGTDHSERPSIPSKEQCALCRSESHSMSGHLKASKGQINACILCNRTNHYVDTCDKFKAMTMSEQMDLLVASRANMPAVKTSVPWHELLWHYLQSNESKGQDAKIPDVFPWSESFAIERAFEDHGKAILALQAKYDQAGNKDPLPVDPDTSSMEAIFQNFWAPKGYIWPESLAQASR
ncbi:hypothetical protein FSARC_3443 [Fusarium sarcochroum]|uniref:Uncharacterized protein n=1 Tax=Fusarium sarcochroum TaxID=1208366 RepID=A0A8H4XBR5_9HYPO|nr:hypothetical protein FSARC_3443 [Fusarium sarcochroum]